MSNGDGLSQLTRLVNGRNRRDLAVGSRVGEGPDSIPSVTFCHDRSLRQSGPNQPGALPFDLI